MGIFSHKRKQISDIKLINCFRPVSQHRKKMRGADYLYLLVCLLVVFGIVKQLEINRLKKAFPVAVLGQGMKKVEPSPTPRIEYIEKEDPRIEKVRAFLTKRNSPLAPYADILVQKSDEYALDYTLILSIAGKESGYGVHCSNFNAWGIMTWNPDGSRRLRRFTSWPEGIEYEANLLSETYRPHMIKGIQLIYCPSFECSNTWVEDVVTFSKEIREGGSNDK